MTLWRSQPHKFFAKQLAATILATWLSGATCLLCCGPMEKSSAEEENCSATLAINTPTTELCHEDDCCKEDSDSDHSPTELPCQDECCILNAPVSELPGTLKQHQLSVVSSFTPSSLALAEPIKNKHLSFANKHLTKGQTIYLRCCVFLI